MLKCLLLFIGLMLTPFYVASLLVALAYRLIVHAWLKCTHPNYAGLLGLIETSFTNDEDQVNCHVINIFAYLKPTAVNSGEELRRCILEKFENTLSKKGIDSPKYVFETKFGLKCWRIDETPLKDQFISFSATNPTEVRDYLSKVANIPIRNKRLFEFHVGDHLVNGNYPLVFRVHHAMGDGYAIRQFLLEEQVTQSDVFKAIPKPRTTSDRKEGTLGHKLVLISDILKVVVFTPAMTLERFFLAPVDENSLKTDSLSGQKILRWRTGDMRKIKEIQRVKGKTFTEIFLTALSKSVDDLFKSRGESVPYVTTVFPKRKTQNSSGMANEFIPVGVQLPVRTQNREKDIEAEFQRLDKTPAYKSNYYIARHAFVVFPFRTPDRAYRCSETTSVFSNVPGTQSKVVYKEFEVEDIAFFLPNIVKHNGFGVMVTSYVDKFVCSVIIDRSITRSDDDAEKIVDGIMTYIDIAHKELPFMEKINTIIKIV